MKHFNVSCNFLWEIRYRKNSWRQLFLREIIFKQIVRQFSVSFVTKSELVTSSKLRRKNPSYTTYIGSKILCIKLIILFHQIRLKSINFSEHFVFQVKIIFENQCYVKIKWAITSLTTFFVPLEIKILNFKPWFKKICRYVAEYL